MPPGLRSSLYIKDDDYRHSFLFGNFISLTNLTKEDLERLAEQRLSPLYVSVHATDPALRSRLFGTIKAREIVEQIERLGSLGIQIHAQVVLIPGVNDGQALERTVKDLARLHPTVASVALVPVGLTRHHDCGLRLITPGEAKAVLQSVAGWQIRFRQSFGTGFAYPSDEIYLLAGEDVPSADRYDGFPQLANGVGLVRQLLDDWQQTLALPAQYGARLRAATLVCGTLIAPTLQQQVSRLAASLGIELRLVAVANRFFGATVTVSGLLTGQDVLAALRGQALGDRVILPRGMFDANRSLTLDDLSPSDIAAQLGVTVGAADRLSNLLPQLLT
jgi:putative radical SAM enzyme (TIGR03279 family)